MEPPALEPSPATRPRWPRIRFWLVIAAAAAAYAVQAWHAYPVVASSAGGLFLHNDSAYHARRVLMTVEGGTFLPPVFDPLEAWPQGARALWPPLHDASVAFLARLGGSTRSDPGRGMVTAAAFPVLEGIGLIFAVALLARRLAGEPLAGIVAAWLAAASPVLALGSKFGTIDHHLTEALLTVALSAFLTAPALERDGLKEALGAAAGWAALVLASLGFFGGVVLGVGILGAGAAVSQLLPGTSPASRVAGRLSLGFGLGALMLPFFASLRVTPDSADPWRLGPSYVILLGAAATGLAAVSIIRSLAARSVGPEWPVPAAGLALGFFAMLLQPPAAWRAITRGLGFFGADPWLATIVEFQPPWKVPLAWLGTSPAGPVAFACVLLAVVLASRSSDVRARLRRAVPVLFAFAAFTLLELRQARFTLVWISLTCISAGVLWSACRHGRPMVTGGLVGVAVLGFVFGGMTQALAFAGATFDPGGAVWRDTTGLRIGRGIRATAPGTGSPQGVLAPWDWGHHIVLASGAPVVLTPFGSMVGGFQRGMEVFLATDLRSAVAGLDALKVGWVAVGHPDRMLPEIRRALGQDRSGVGRATPLASAAGEGIPFCRRVWDLVEAPPGSDEDPLKRLHLVADTFVNPDPDPDGGPLEPYRLYRLLPP